MFRGVGSNLHPGRTGFIHDRSQVKLAILVMISIEHVKTRCEEEEILFQVLTDNSDCNGNDCVFYTWKSQSFTPVVLCVCETTNLLMSTKEEFEEFMSGIKLRLLFDQ